MDSKADMKVYEDGNHIWRIEGCCTELAAFLKRENLDLIMEMMKFSIASTIPRSSLYTNATMRVPYYASFFPHTRILSELLKNG